MIKCLKCSQEFKTSQALHGHAQFKHTDFLSSKDKRAERILIGNKVFKTDELRLELDSVVQIKKLAMKLEIDMDETVWELLDNRKSYFDLLDKLERFKKTECYYCNEDVWLPSKDEVWDEIVYCCWCGGKQHWVS